MNAKRRQVLLIAVLVLTAAALAWDRSRGPAASLSKAVVRSNTNRQTAAPPDTAPSSVLAVVEIKSRSEYRSKGADAFPPASPVTPSPATGMSPVLDAPPTPTAPPLPFTVVGKKFEAGAWEVYLAKGDQTYIATLGATVADDYRVNSIMPTQITLTYLPLNTKQTMPTGASLHD